MTKRWSSFEGQQLLQENWRNFLSEESETAAWMADHGYGVEDSWEKPEEPEEDPQASDYPDVSTGLTSDYKRDSLKQVLAPILDGEKGPEHIQALINVIAQIAGDEGIMLELSLKGLNSEQDRIIDSAGTALILKTISGFALQDAENTALIKALNYWGRVNSVKFTAPPVAAPSVVNTTDPSDDVSQGATATSDEPPDEESTTIGGDALGPGPEPEPETEPEPEPVYETGPNGETFVGHLNDTWQEWAAGSGKPFYYNNDTKQTTWIHPEQTGEEEPETPMGPLQETYDRWQTIAGINKRVL
jgi:hypothetical protein